jgi:hypothetical protein
LLYTAEKDSANGTVVLFEVFEFEAKCRQRTQQVCNKKLDLPLVLIWVHKLLCLPSPEASAEQQ